MKIVLYASGLDGSYLNVDPDNGTAIHITGKGHREVAQRLITLLDRPDPATRLAIANLLRDLKAGVASVDGLQFDQVARALRIDP